MTTHEQDPKKPGERPGTDQPAMFRGGADGAASGGGRTALITIGVGVAVIAGVLAFRFSRTTPPAPAPVTSAARPSPRPLDVPEGATVHVPGGTFQLGSEEGDPDEKPVTQVTVAPFELDLTEVTVAAYAKCVAAGKCTAPDTGMYCNWKKDGRGAHPVNCIDWKQAGEYCAFVGARLPAEEEWEFAARGTDGRQHPWKEGAPAAQLCWSGDGNDQGRGNRQGTCPVASYPAGASPFGALDMAGNVWEWTSSAHCPYSNRGCSDDRRVIRGGGWNNLMPSYVRAQDRAVESPTSRPDNVGVRCAKNG